MVGVLREGGGGNKGGVKHTVMEMIGEIDFAMHKLKR